MLVRKLYQGTARVSKFQLAKLRLRTAEALL